MLSVLARLSGASIPTSSVASTSRVTAASAPVSAHRVLPAVTASAIVARRAVPPVSRVVPVRATGLVVRSALFRPGLSATTFFTPSLQQLQTLPVRMRQRQYSTQNDDHSGTRRPEFVRSSSNLLVLLLLGAGVLLYVYKVYKDNNPTEVIDTSVLRDDRFEDQDMFVIDAMKLKAIDKLFTSGRSHGHMVRVKISKEQRDYYYYKKPFGRDVFLNELVLGALLRDMFKMTNTPFPKVYAVERALTEIDNQSEYSFISENIGGREKNINLEDLVIRSHDNKKELPELNNLGVVIALNMLFGNSDCKLANIVLDVHQYQHCYAIDHEAAFVFNPAILMSGRQGVAFIGEFREKSFNDRLIEQNAEGAIDTDENIRQPLKANKEIKEYLRPILAAAIQRDIDSGAVDRVYRQFAELREDEMKRIISKFGTLIHENDCVSFINAFKARQEVVRKHLANQAEKTLQHDHESVPGIRLR